MKALDSYLAHANLLCLATATGSTEVDNLAVYTSLKPRRVITNMEPIFPSVTTFDNVKHMYVQSHTSMQHAVGTLISTQSGRHTPLVYH